MILRTTFVLTGAVLLGGVTVSAQRVTDAQITAIVVTANQLDIGVGKLAESKATDPEFKAFGKQMVTDHTGVNKQATDLVTKLDVTPEDNATARSLKSGGTERRAAFEAAGCRVRQGVHRARGGVSPAGARCAGQDVDS